MIFQIKQYIQFLILGIFMSSFMLHAQIQKTLAESTGTNADIYPLDASRFLWKKEMAVREYLRTHPDATKRTPLQKTEAYIVGSKKSWYADNFVTDQRYQVPSTCKAVGTNCYVFVEDASWTSGKITQAAVDSVILYFDSKTPANSSKGIYQTDVDVFGNPPNVDGDAKIIIFLLDIIDGYTGSGGYTAGYFYSYNEINSTQPGYSTSNFAEIFFIDVNPGSLTTAGGLNNAISTLAHEFQHMIHWNYDKYEWSFVNEGCSTFAEVACGYPIYNQTYFNGEPNHYLLDWRRDDPKVLNDYSRTARFFVYLRDQVGMDLFKNIVSSTLTGVEGINAGFTAIGSSLTFADALKNWFIANILNDRTIDTKYGYTYPNLAKPSAITYINHNVPLTKDSIEKYAVRYILFKSGTQLKVKFTVSNPALQIKAVEIGASSKRIVDVASGVEFTDPLYGTTYTEIYFLVMNTSGSSGYSYTYQASGTGETKFELRYDYTEPTGIYSLAANDTVCVSFDAIQGGRLDSVRVALRRTSNLRGGIWRSTGVARPSPLGEPLATNLTAISKLTVNPPVPYPIPWNNWATIDLRSLNINTNSPFVVGFIIDGNYTVGNVPGGTPTTYNYVMTTPMPYGNGPRSFTYSSGSSNGPNWYYYSVNSAGDSVVGYLIRAYVSLIPSDVNSTVELAPSEFHLDQNYPNPFNPSTVIRFALPERSFTTLKVYDLVGREVATLVNGLQNAGNHEVTFDAAHLPSGVYLYRITTEKRIETKKLVLIK